MDYITAATWRERLRADRAALADAPLTIRLPKTLRDFLNATGNETGATVSDLVRWALLDWAMATTSPNLAARREFLRNLFLMQCTSDDSDDLVDWADANEPLTRELERAVRLGDSDQAESYRANLAELLRSGDFAPARQSAPLINEAQLRVLVHDVVAAMKSSGEL